MAIISRLPVGINNNEEHYGSAGKQTSKEMMQTRVLPEIMYLL